MSQQGFQSQEPDESTGNGYGEAQRSAKRRDVPKSEHPSNYSEVTSEDSKQANYQSGYRSQGNTEYAQHAERGEKNTQNRAGQAQPNKGNTTYKDSFKADGDAFESSYRPFGQAPYQQQSWRLFRRTTRNFTWWQWVIITICAVTLCGLVIQLLFYLISVAVALFFILLGILIIMRLLGFPIFRSRRWVGGPWRWWR